MENQLVVFTVANESYGVNIAAVSEIIMLQPITHVPRAPAFVEGVTNLRGKVLPVIDLRKRFGLAQQPNTKETRIVVAEINQTPVGMMVDAVNQVLRVPEGAVEPPSPVVTTVDSAFISGIAKVANRIIILLDLEKVLLPGEKADLQQVVLVQEATPPPAAEPAAVAPTEPPAELALLPAAEPVAAAPAEPPRESTAQADAPARPKRKRGRRKSSPQVAALGPDSPPPAEA